MSESWLTEFEAQLQQLERDACAGETLFADLLKLAASALSTLGSDIAVEQWLVRPDSLESITADGRTQAVKSESQPGPVEAAGQGHLLQARSDVVHHNRLYLSNRLAQQLTFVLATDYGELHCPQNSFTEGARAVTDIVGTFVSRHLLSQYEARIQSQAGLTELVAGLHQSTSLQQAANIIAQDGAALLGHTRVTVLAKRDGRFRAEAITGVNAPELSSDSVRALQSMAERLLQKEQTVVEQSAGGTNWSPLASLIADPELSEAASCLHSQGARVLRVAPLGRLNGNGDKGSAAAVVVIELFDDSPLPDEAFLQQLLNAAEVPVQRHFDGQHTLLSRLVTTRRRRWLIGLGVTALALVVIPVDFEVEVPGKILSANQRHVFAPDDGTIDEVLFENESKVDSQAVLLRMSNADLELQLQQLQGEIETTSSKLAAVRQQGILNRPDAALSGDEQHLDKHVKNLKQQRDLLTQQSASLEIRAPFAGTVFRPDPQQELHSRPVQRGQRLLEIVPEDPAWELQLAIPGHLLSYVTTFRTRNPESMRVRYMIRSTPERDWETQLSDLENAVQVQDGATVCHATAKLIELPDVALRPGTSVTARISCGRRSLGFVVFREVIEFWHQVRFAWL